MFCESLKTRFSRPRIRQLIWATFSIATVLSVTLSIVNATEAEDQPIAERFRSEAPAAWEALEHAGNSLDVECTEVATTRYDTKGTAEKTVRQRLVFKSKPDCLLSQCARLDQDGVPAANATEALNADYAFAVSRSGEGAWLLRHASPMNKEAVTRNISTRAFIYAHAPWEILEYGSLRSLGKNPNFSVTSIESVAGESGELARVSFSQKVVANAGKWVTLRSGWLLLDPKMYWCIREFSVSIASDTSAADIHGRITYGDHRDALPHPTHYAFTLVNKKKRATIEDAFDYKKFDYRDPPLAEFRLPAFGLPEYVTSRARSASLRLPAVTRLRRDCY